MRKIIRRVLYMLLQGVRFYVVCRVSEFIIRHNNNTMLYLKKNGNELNIFWYIYIIVFT